MENNIYNNLIIRIEEKSKKQYFFDKEVKVYYNLREPKKRNKPSIIYMILNCEGQKLKLSTNVKVTPDQWDWKHQSAIVSHRSFDKYITSEKIQLET